MIMIIKYVEKNTVGSNFFAPKIGVYLIYPNRDSFFSPYDAYEYGE